MTRRPRLCLIHAFTRCSRKAVFLFLILGKGCFGKLHFFGWSRGPAADLLLCASVQFSHKVNQKSHVALKNDSRPFVKNDLCPKRIPGYYDQIDCVLKTIGSNGDTSTRLHVGLGEYSYIYSFGPLSHCP